MSGALLRVVGFVSLFSAGLVAQEIPQTEPVTVVGREAYSYTNVVTGGVGQVTGMVWSARRPECLIIRGESGGIWKLDRTSNAAWISLTDSIPFRWGELTYVESVAVHPDNPDVIYIASGMRSAREHDLLKTEDGGKTWRRLNVTNAAGRPVRSDSDGEYREAGERLAIDINAPEILFFATRNDGLLTSRDGGETWEVVESFPTKGRSWAGLMFVAGDFTTGQSGKPTQRWYVGVCPDRRAQISGGLYVTEDAGESWMRVTEGPGLDANTIPLRGRVAPDGTLYLTTYNDRVWRMRGGVWHDITPQDRKGRPFCGVNFDPRNPARVVVAELLRQGGTSFYYSENGGESWRRYSHDPQRQGNSVRFADYPAWLRADGSIEWGANTADIAFDPVEPSRVWHMSSSGVCSIDGVGEARVTVSLVGAGREQTNSIELISPNEGAPLISGVYGFGGFRHGTPEDAPTSRLRRQERDGSWNREPGLRGYQAVLDMDIHPDNPDRVVLCGGWPWNQTGEAGYSLDNGRLFRAFVSRPFDGAQFGRIALGVDPINVVWAPAGNATTSVYYTVDNGQSWFPSDGAPLGMISTQSAMSFYRCLAADRVRPGVFYLYDRRDGRFYRTEDGGRRFHEVSTLPRQAGVHGDWHRLESVPGRGGELWLALREHGLFRSSDGGSSWVKLAGITWAENIAIGKAKTAEDYPALYFFGQIGGEQPTDSTVDCRLYRSDDAGESWVQINDESVQAFPTFGPAFAGDMQEHGVVYVGTRSRGIFRGAPQQ